MKKLIFVIPFIILCSCTSNPEAYKSARFYFGLKLDKKVEPVLYEEYWSWKGEGMVNIIYEFDSISNETFLKRNSLSNYKSLPIIEAPPVFTPYESSNYIPPDLYHHLFFSNDYEFIDHKGKYKMLCKTGERSSSIVLYDEDLMKLFMYYSVDNERNH